MVALVVLLLGVSGVWGRVWVRLVLGLQARDEAGDLRVGVRWCDLCGCVIMWCGEGGAKTWPGGRSCWLSGEGCEGSFWGERGLGCE
jgi:hypothetical protein